VPPTADPATGRLGRNGPPPRDHTERSYNVQRWFVAPRGGHFPTLEVPDMFVQSCALSSLRCAEPSSCETIRPGKQRRDSHETRGQGRHHLRRGIRQKAILLLEETCEKFSNIDGLGYIPFPTGKIRAAFEDIREVLKREGLIEVGSPSSASPPERKGRFYTYPRTPRDS
jgi:hypothetical protein